MLKSCADPYQPLGSVRRVVLALLFQYSSPQDNPHLDLPYPDSQQPQLWYHGGPELYTAQQSDGVNAARPRDAVQHRVQH